MPHSLPSYDLRPRVGERPTGVALPCPLELPTLAKEELTASQAVVLLQSAAVVQESSKKDADSLENVSPPDVTGCGQCRPPQAESTDRPVWSYHSDRVHMPNSLTLPPTSGGSDPPPQAAIHDLSPSPQSYVVIHDLSIYCNNAPLTLYGDEFDHVTADSTNVQRQRVNGQGHSVT